MARAKMTPEITPPIVCLVLHKLVLVFRSVDADPAKLVESYALKMSSHGCDFKLAFLDLEELTVFELLLDE